MLQRKQEAFGPVQEATTTAIAATQIINFAEQRLWKQCQEL